MLTYEQAASLPNPYSPGSMAHRAFAKVQETYREESRSAAMTEAKEIDRNIEVGLARRVAEWPLGPKR